MVDRLVAAFVAPVESRPAMPRPALPEPVAPPAIAVLCAAPLALAAGGAVALACASGPAVVAVWGDEPRGTATTARPAARRLATRLTARGHTATATGRLVRVALSGPDEAARVAAAAGTVTVTAIAGPRDGQVDRVIAAHDRVLVIGDGLVASLAVDSLRDLGVSAGTLALPDALPARVLAASGVALVAPWRALVAEALR